jgi:hypothetical protein
LVANWLADGVRNNLGSAFLDNLASGVSVRNALLLAYHLAGCVANVLNSLFANHFAGCVVNSLLTAFWNHLASGVGANLGLWLAYNLAGGVVNSLLTALWNHLASGVGDSLLTALWH